MSEPPERLFTPAFLALTLSELAYFTVGGLVIAITPFFVSGPIGSDEAGLGLTAAAFGVTTLLLRPFAGRSADRRGRRPLLVGGALLCALVVVAHILPLGLAALVVLRLLLGVAETFYFVAGYAALADLAPPGRTGEALSFNSIALYLGLALGPIIGQGLLRVGGFDLVWIGGFAIALLAAALALRIPETSSGEARATAALGAAPPLFHRAALGPGLGLCTGVAAMSAYLILAGPHAERLGLDAWSVTFLIYSAVVLTVRIAFARLPDRVAPMRLGGMALVLVAVGLGVLAVGPGLGGLIPGTVLLASGVAFMTPAFFAATFARVAAAERGVAAGTGSFFIDLGFTGGPFVAGFVAAAAGIPAAFGVAGAVALVGALGVAMVVRLSRPAVPAH